ncbi:MAG: sigma-54-dependent Fis family transcriptional regulator [Archangium sp.]|nr:sigma-54-dependent Fis family transcriptional regulator [Archangium sp.]
MAEILLVEDERNLRSLFEDLLTARGHRVVTCESITAARESLKRRLPDAMVVDVKLPDGEGIALLDRRVPAVVMTAFGTLDRAVQALRAGAVDFLVKPFDNARLLASVEEALAAGEELEELELTNGAIASDTSLAKELIGAEGGLASVVVTLPRIAATDATVLINGESGTGKELVSRAIHRSSGRRDGPFVAVNCAALPPSLLESELFGFERGAFTGAHARKVGVIEAASGGTLFLDEIGDMALEAQARLLRVIQERELVRVGGREPVKVDVRLVAATHRDLQALVRAGQFREDLLYRLNVVPIHLPALRERLVDLPALLAHFMERHATRHRLSRVDPSAEAWEWMRRHPWPGNVRELENWVERAVILQRFEVPRQEVTEPPPPEPPPAPATTRAVKSLREAVAEAERAAVVAALEAADGNKAEAARLLGVSYKTLFNKLHEHGIQERQSWS